MPDRRRAGCRRLTHGVCRRRTVLPRWGTITTVTNSTVTNSTITNSTVTTSTVTTSTVTTTGITPAITPPWIPHGTRTTRAQGPGRKRQ